MTMFEGSRYTNVYTFEREERGKRVTAFNSRRLLSFNTEQALEHTWIEGDRLDNLAMRYYGDPTYWWFILDVNNQYLEEHEIRNGDKLMIPPYSELARVVEDRE